MGSGKWDVIVEINFHTRKMLRSVNDLLWTVDCGLWTACCQLPTPDY